MYKQFNWSTIHGVLLRRSTIQVSCYVVGQDAGVLLCSGAQYMVSCYVVEHDTECLVT